MKKRFFALFLTLVNLLFVVSIAAADKADKVVGPLCFIWGYEPDFPESLKK